MISRYNHQKINWIDLESPTHEEIVTIAEEFDLHPVVSSELLNPSERAKVDVYSNAIFLVLHFPIRNKKTERVEETEVDFVLTENNLITTHYELVDPLHEFAKVFEVGSYLNNGKNNTHAGFLFFFAVRELYKNSLFLLESLGHDIRDIEKQIFAGNEAEMVANISMINRALIDIKQSMRYHKETLKSFSQACIKMYGEDFAYYLSAIEGEYERIEQLAEESRQMIRDLRETNDSLLSAKTTATIKRLTAVNVVVLPIMLIIFIFGMNSVYLRLDDIKSVTAVFGVMLVVGLISFIYFRSKKWL
ncbi:MAG: CorA family divalent cation transporter [bacterium]